MVTTRARQSTNKVMAHHDGDEHNAGNRDGSFSENDGIHNDGNEGSVGDDVDEVNNGYKSPVVKKYGFFSIIVIVVFAVFIIVFIFAVFVLIASNAFLSITDLIKRCSSW